MRTASVTYLLILAAAPARAGELDINLGLQATHTAWDDDRGGGPVLGASYYLRDWIGINFTGKEHYATVDERYMSYFSLGAIVRTKLERLRLAASLGLVHQHEQTKETIEAMPIESAFGVADGIRHRAASRAGVQLAVPFRARSRGEWYIALDLDATVFAEEDRGPRWMSSAGLSIGVTHDFGKRAPQGAPR